MVVETVLAITAATIALISELMALYGKEHENNGILHSILRSDCIKNFVRKYRRG